MAFFISSTAILIFFILNLYFARKKESKEFSKKILEKDKDSERLINEQISINDELKIQNKLLHDKASQLIARNEIISKSLHYAKRIQYSILPGDDLIKRALPESFILFYPKDIVSGDFYWMHYDEIAKKTQIAVADCTGHGVPGAFMAMIGNTLLNEVVKEKKISNPAIVLKIINKSLLSIFGDQKSQTFFDESDEGIDMTFCEIDFNKNTISISTAIHKYYIVNGNQLKSYAGSFFSLGGILSRKKEAVYEENTFQIEKGMTLYMFSDGFLDQFGGKAGERFGEENLKKIITENNDSSIYRIRTILDDAFKNWKGKYDQIDDVLLFAIRF